MENPNVYYVNQNPEPKKGFAIAGLALGIASLVLGYEAWTLGVATGIVGLVLSIQAKKSYEAIGLKSGMATAGFVLSIVGLALSAVGLVVCISCGSCLTLAGSGALIGEVENDSLASDLLEDLSSDIVNEINSAFA